MNLLHRFALATVYLALTSGLSAQTLGASNGARVEKSLYGTTSSNVPIDQYTLRNANGLEVTIITYGAIITSIENPARQMPNIVLGFNNLNDYETKNSPGPHFGALIGRYANRIANGVSTLD